MENEIFKGVVEGKDVTEGEKNDGSKWIRASFQISGTKFSTFDEKIINAFDIGATVEATYYKKDVYNNLTSMKETVLTGSEVNAATTVRTAPRSIKDESIIRQCCIKAASNVTSHIVDENALDDPTRLASATIHVAELLESWVNRE